MAIDPLSSRSPEARKFLDELAVWIYLIPKHCGCSFETAEKLLREIGPLIATDRRAQRELGENFPTREQVLAGTGLHKAIERMFVKHLPMPCPIKLHRNPSGELRFRLDGDKFTTAFAVSPSDQWAVDKLGPHYLEAHAYRRFKAFGAESQAAELAGFEVWTNQSTTDSVVFCPDHSIHDEKFTDPESAWVGATNAHLGTPPGVDRGDRVDMQEALAAHRVFRQGENDDDFFFVALSVDLPKDAQFYRTKGWVVDCFGKKLAEPGPVMLEQSHLRALSADERELLKDLNTPAAPGKGELQCEVLDDHGDVVRRVHLKARFNPASMEVSVVGLPMLLDAAAGQAQDLDFNPFEAPDPLTGQVYSVFTYVDDCGMLFTADQNRVSDDGRKVVVFREPSSEEVQSLVAVAEQLANQG